MKTLKVLLQEVVSGIKAWVNSNFAQESNTVHKTGNETVNGIKILKNVLRSTSNYEQIQTTGFDVRTDPEADRGRDIFKVWDSNNSETGDYLGGMSYYQQTDGSSRLQLICFGYPTTGNPTQQRINFHAYRDGIGSFYPVRSNVNLGTSAYPWASIYAQNYYYKGTQWGLDKSNVWTHWQTIQNTNNHPHLRLKRTDITIGDEIPESYKDIGSIGFTGSDDHNIGLIDCGDDSSGKTFTRILTRQRYDANGNRANDGTTYEARLELGVDASHNYYFIPNPNKSIDLGDSTHQWKSINGLNPGSLSLPDSSDFDPIDVKNWDMTGTANTFTATEDGWLELDSLYATRLVAFNATTHFGMASETQQDRSHYAYIPMLTGESATIHIVGQSITARFYPAKGNV